MAINCWNVFSKQYYWGENNLLEVLVKPSPGMRGSRPHRFPAEAAAQPAAKLFRELVLQSAMSMQDADRTEDDRKTEMELSGLSLEVLRRGDYALYRLKPDSGEKNLLVIPSLEAVTSNSRLQHELGLKAELDAKWAAQPIALPSSILVRCRLPMHFWTRGWLIGARAATRCVSFFAAVAVWYR